MHLEYYSKIFFGICPMLGLISEELKANAFLSHRLVVFTVHWMLLLWVHNLEF